MTEANVAKARELREQGLSYRKIGNILGIANTTIRRWLNPAVRRQDAQYRRKHREEIKQWHVQHYKENKEEIARQRAEYRRENREAIKQRGAKYYQENKDKVLQRQARHYQEHKEEIDERHAEYRQRHKAERTRYDAEYRHENKEKIAKQVARWQRENPEKVKRRNAKRHALKAETSVDLTTDQIEEIDQIYRKAGEKPKVRCYLCGELISKGHRHVDHIEPLSKGGKHLPSNLAVACDTCNLSKQDKLPNEIGILV